MLNFGIDFRHAVEFSRIGRTPRFILSFEAPGQPAKHYCFVRGQSNRPLSSQSLCVSQWPNPAWGVIRLLGPSGSSERPAASASRTRSNKKNITDIRGADANRGPPTPRSPLRTPSPIPPVTPVHPRHADMPPASRRGPFDRHVGPPHHSRSRPAYRSVGDGVGEGHRSPTPSRTAPPSRRLSASGRS
jgi:hypothetical protein